MAKKKNVSKSAVVDLTAIANSLREDLENEAKAKEEKQKKIAEDAVKNRADAAAKKAEETAKEDEGKQKRERVRFTREDYDFFSLGDATPITREDGLDDIWGMLSKYPPDHPQRVLAEEAMENFLRENPAAAREFHVREFCVMASACRKSEIPYNIVRHLLATGLPEFRELNAEQAHAVQEQIDEIKAHRKTAKEDKGHNSKSCDVCMSSPGYKFETTRRVAGKPDEVIHFLAKHQPKRVGRDEEEPVEVRQSRRCFGVLMAWREEKNVRGAEIHGFFKDHPVDRSLNLKDLVYGQAQSEDQTRWVRGFIPNRSPLRSVRERDGRVFTNAGELLVRQISDNGASPVQFEITAPETSDLYKKVEAAIQNRLTFEFILTGREEFQNLRKVERHGPPWVTKEVERVLTHALGFVREKAEDGETPEAAAAQG